MLMYSLKVVDQVNLIAADFETSLWASAEAHGYALGVRRGEGKVLPDEPDASSVADVPEGLTCRVLAGVGSAASSGGKESMKALSRIVDKPLPLLVASQDQLDAVRAAMASEYPHAVAGQQEARPGVVGVLRDVRRQVRQLPHVGLRIGVECADGFPVGTGSAPQHGVDDRGGCLVIAEREERQRAEFVHHGVVGDELDRAVDQLQALLDHESNGDAEKHARYFRDKVIPAMNTLREAGDNLESLVPHDMWSLPTYREMLFVK